MNDQEPEEELAGFCFDCAVKATSSLSIPQIRLNRHTQLQNPWPMLIQSGKLDHMRSQPLTRTVYCGMPLTDFEVILSRRLHSDRTRPRPEDLIDFRSWFIYQHERCHLSILNWTPAKELARFCLSIIYSYVSGFAGPIKLVEETWKDFTEYTRYLSRIIKSIGFIEELIATAFAIEQAEAEMLPGGMWVGFQEELEALKEIFLANEEKNFLGFRVYYSRIKPLFQLMYRNPPLAAQAIPLLQPMRFEDDGSPGVYNAWEHLDTILHLIIDIEDAEEAGRRFQELYELNKGGWQEIIAILIELASKSANEETSFYKDSQYMFTRMLWNISWGYQDDWRLHSRDDRFTLAGHIIERSQEIFSKGLTLKPGVRHDQFTIIDRNRIVYIAKYESASNSKVVRDDSFYLLLYEAIRQQLLARKGFVCPIYSCSQDGRSCLCPPGVQRYYHQLSYLAFDGLFGPGEWSLPPCLDLRRR